MKPVDFDYVRPATLAAAIELLASHAGVARAVAGAQSLGPMLNLRLVQPELLVDVTAIPELLEVREDGGSIVIGAGVTHARLEDDGSAERTRAVLATIAGGIAYRAVRNRGTIGGSLAHADPAADWPVCCAALGARLSLCGTGGQRSIAATDFIVGGFQTVLAAGELIVELSVPRLAVGARWGYFKMCRKRGEFALASAAVLIDEARGVHRFAIGATSGRPIVIESPEPLGEAAAVGALRNALASSALADDTVAIRLHGAALRRAMAMAAA